jgi:N-carbamoyl-L-amino-acid hydrolase
MALRKDALQVATRIMQEVVAIALRYPPYGRGTVGMVHVHPNSRNVIPGHREVLDRPAQRRQRPPRRRWTPRSAPSSRRPPRRAGLPITHRAGLATSRRAPSRPSCVEAVAHGRRCARLLAMEAVSGAGHDAVYMARLAPERHDLHPLQGLPLLLRCSVLHEGLPHAHRHPPVHPQDRHRATSRAPPAPSSTPTSSG